MCGKEKARRAAQKKNDVSQGMCEQDKNSGRTFVRKAGEDAGADLFCHFYYGGQPCGLQRKIRMETVFACDAGNRKIPGAFQMFVDSKSGMKSAEMKRKCPDAVLRSERGINGKNRRAWVVRANDGTLLMQVQSMNWRFERAVDRKRTAALQEKTSSDWAEAVTDQTICSNA